MAAKKSGWDKWREKKMREAKKNIKKAHFGYIVIAVLFLAAGLAAGYFGAQFITKNDVFEINGEKVTSVKVGEALSYTDEGIKYVSFGKDASDSVQISTNMVKGENGVYTADTTEEGEYYIIYKAVGGRCDGLTLYRVFRVTETAEGGSGL